MSITELTAITTELQEYTRIAEEANAAADALKDKVKAYMGDEEQLTAGPYKVTYKAVTTTRIDSKALTADHPDIAAQYTKATTARRFSVK